MSHTILKVKNHERPCDLCKFTDNHQDSIECKYCLENLEKNEYFKPEIKL